MAARARKNRRQEEETLQLDQVLEPYDNQQFYGQQFQYDEPMAYEEAGDNQLYQQVGYQTYQEAGYADELPLEDELQENGDPEMRFGVAVHVFDVISSLVGVFVILVLLAMLLTLVDWLRTDILHSFVMLQSGIS